MIGADNGEAFIIFDVSVAIHLNRDRLTGVTCRKGTVPEGNTPPTKSLPVACALLTAHWAVLPPDVSPLRFTVKVKALLPLLPSSWAALLEAIERVVAMIKKPYAEIYFYYFSINAPPTTRFITYLQILMSRLGRCSIDTYACPA